MGKFLGFYNSYQFNVCTNDVQNVKIKLLQTYRGFMSNSCDKSKRANIRLTEEEKLIITKAASLQKKSFSAFMIENSYAAASEIIANQTVFRLSEKNWKTFCDILDRPPQENAKLKKLLTEPSLFDE